MVHIRRRRLESLCGADVTNYRITAEHTVLMGVPVVVGEAKPVDDSVEFYQAITGKERLCNKCLAKVQELILERMKRN